MKRPNGQGSIYFEKAKNRYAASFITPEGKRVVKRFKTPEDAENWLEDNRYKIRHNTFVSPSTLRTGQWILQYLDTYKKNVRPQTMFNYLAMMDKLDPIANIPLQRLTGLDVQNLINAMQAQNLSSGYIQAVYHILSMAIKKAVALELLSKSPLATVERPTTTHRKIQIFTIDEVKQLLNYTKNTHWQRLHVEILLAAYTGMRIGEILALSWSDISPSFIKVSKTLARDGYSLMVQNTTKTDSSRREISIPLSVYNELMEWKSKNRTFGGQVFKTYTGKIVAPNNESLSFKKVQVALGISPLRGFHALRHTHASQLLAHGVPIAEVAKRLGHANPSITLNTYASWIPGNDKKVASDVEKIFS